MNAPLCAEVGTSFRVAVVSARGIHPGAVTPLPVRLSQRTNWVPTRCSGHAPAWPAGAMGVRVLLRRGGRGRETGDDERGSDRRDGTEDVKAGDTGAGHFRNSLLRDVCSDW